VIGAGPAGLAAAATSAEAGLSTLLLDENIGPVPGVSRHLVDAGDRAQPARRRLLGRSDLVQALRTSNAEIIQRATVWSLDRNLDIAVSIGGASAFVKAKRGDPGERRAGAAVSDSRLDAAGRDDGRCRADHVEVVGACSRRAPR